MNNQPLLFTICNDKWAYGHLLRWYRYARLNSECRLGVILISDNDKLVEEVTEQFDEVVVFPVEKDNRDFYNEVRLIAPKLFKESCIYDDCDSDVWSSLADIMDGVEEIGCVGSPGHFKDWEKMGEGKKENNNGFLVLNYSPERADEIANVYADCMKAATDADSLKRVSGSIAFNIMLRGGLVKWTELPYATSVIWWDDLAMIDAKVIQWCNDKGQAKRLLLEAEWANGGDHFREAADMVGDKPIVKDTECACGAKPEHIGDDSYEKWHRQDCSMFDGDHPEICDNPTQGIPK